MVNLRGMKQQGSTFFIGGSSTELAIHSEPIGAFDYVLVLFNQSYYLTQESW